MLVLYFRPCFVTTTMSADHHRRKLAGVNSIFGTQRPQRLHCYWVFLRIIDPCVTQIYVGVCPVSSIAPGYPCYFVPKIISLSTREIQISIVMHHRSTTRSQRLLRYKKKLKDRCRGCFKNEQWIFFKLLLLKVFGLIWDDILWSEEQEGSNNFDYCGFFVRWEVWDHDSEVKKDDKNQSWLLGSRGNTTLVRGCIIFVRCTMVF